MSWWWHHLSPSAASSRARWRRVHWGDPRGGHPARRRGDRGGAGTRLGAPQPRASRHRQRQAGAPREGGAGDRRADRQHPRVVLHPGPVVGANSGPTVTQYELQPAAGVPVRKIVGAQTDLSLALAAPIRIQPFIPGKSAVGIEVPNKAAQLVSLKEIVTAPSSATPESGWPWPSAPTSPGTPWSAISAACPICSSPARREVASPSASTRSWRDSCSRRHLRSSS